MLADVNAKCTAGADHMARVNTLLCEALDLLDKHANAPDLGARLQGIIDSLEERRP